jgi:hypothetical protein
VRSRTRPAEPMPGAKPRVISFILGANASLSRALFRSVGTD